MDIESIKKSIPELAQVLKAELDGSKGFVFSKLLEGIDMLFGVQNAQIESFKAKLEAAEAKLNEALQAAPVVSEVKG